MLAGLWIQLFIIGLVAGSPQTVTTAAAAKPPTLTLVMTLRVRPSQVYFKTVPVFETSAPDLQWLTRSIFIGTGERYPADVVVRVWRVE